MRKRLRSILIGFLMTNTAACFGENLVKFPETAAGIEELIRWLDGKQNLLPTSTQLIKLDSQTSFVGVMFDTASGVTAIDAYIYVCTPSLCRLLAMRSTNAKSLKLILSSDRKELVLKSENQFVYLRVPISR